MTKEHILSEIRRMARDNGGRPIGRERFHAETEIKPSHIGRFWARWNDAVKESNLAPNQLQTPRTDEDLLSNLSALVRELGRFPAMADIRLRASTNPGFPSHTTFGRFGGLRNLAAKLEEFCRGRGEDDLVRFCVIAAKGKDPKRQETSTEISTTDQEGFVYLVKSGRYYKIGMTKDLGRRGYDLRIQLPEAPNLIHSIRTDDPRGIERYWHTRFAERRKNSEWLDLTGRDVAVFKRRKSFM